MLQQKQAHRHTHTHTLTHHHPPVRPRSPRITLFISSLIPFAEMMSWKHESNPVNWGETHSIAPISLLLSHCVSLHFSSLLFLSWLFFWPTKSVLSFSLLFFMFQWFSRSRPLSTSLITSTPYLQRLSPVHLFLLFMFYLFASFSHNSYLSLSLSFFLRFPPPLPFGIRRIVDVATWEWWGRRSGGLNTEWSAECLETHIHTVTSRLPLSPQSILRNKNILFRFLPLSHTPTHSDTHKMPISYPERLRQHLTLPALPFVLFLPPFPPLINLPCSLSENFIKELQLRLARLVVAIATTLLILWSGQVGEREGGRKSKKAMRGSLDLPSCPVVTPAVITWLSMSTFSPASHSPAVYTPVMSTHSIQVYFTGFRKWRQGLKPGTQWQLVQRSYTVCGLGHAAEQKKAMADENWTITELSGVQFTEEWQSWQFAEGWLTGSRLLTVLSLRYQRVTVLQRHLVLHKARDTWHVLQGPGETPS